MLLPYAGIPDQNGKLVYNVKKYGATGNGITDDITAIQLAIAAAQAAGGGIIFFPYGTYLISVDISLTGSNLTMWGVGRGSLIKPKAASTANGIAITSGSHYTITDIQIDGNKANVTPLGTPYTQEQGIYITNADDITITRTFITNCLASGIMANGGVTNLFVSNNRLTNNGDNQIYVRAKDVSPYTVCSNITITGNICSGGSYSGIQALGSNYVTIGDNVCFNNGPTAGQGDGIGSEGGNYVTIANNVCYNNGVQGIESRFTNEVGTSQKSTHIVIAGNVVYHNTNAGGDNGGIGVNDSDDVLIANNLVYGNTIGININAGSGMGVTNCSVIENKVRSNSDIGIRVSPGNASTFLLANNEVTDNTNDNLYADQRIQVMGGIYARAGAGKEGIHLASGASNSLITGVSVFDNADNGILIDSGVANVEIRDCNFDAITATQTRAIQEQAGGGPTRVINCRVRNQSTSPNYVFNNVASFFADETHPLPQIYTSPAILYYDGPNTSATVADNSTLDMTAAISLEFWYNPDPVQNAYATLVGKNAQYYIEGSGTGTDMKWQLFTKVDGSDRGSGLMNTALTPGVLNHVVMTYDSATHQQKIYLNGVLDFTNTLSGLAGYTLATSTNILYLGTRQGFVGSRNAKGELGDIRIWNGALSATDVTNHYQFPADLATTTTATLVSRWKSNEGSGTSLADTNGSNTATVSSPVWHKPLSPFWNPLSSSQFYWDLTNNRLGLGTASPSELLHLYKATGNFTTMRFDSGTTQGYFFAYDGDTSVNVGSNSNAQFNFRVNNATVGYFDTSGNFGVSNGDVLMAASKFLRSGGNLLIGGNGFNTLVRPAASGNQIQFQNFNGSANFNMQDGGNTSMTYKFDLYNNITTKGLGVPAIYGQGRSTAQTAAVASVATYTVGAADGSFLVSMNCLVTTSTTHSFTLECAYTDEGNTARTVTMNVQQLAGTLITTITNITGAGPYEGVPLHIRAKASTAITLRTQAAGTYTSVVFNIEGIIQQLA